MGKKFIESFKVNLTFPENGFAFVEQIWHFQALHQYSITQNIRFRPLADFQTNTWEIIKLGESF